MKKQINLSEKALKKMIYEAVQKRVNALNEEDYSYYNAYTDKNYNDAFEGPEGNLLPNIIEKAFGDVAQFDEFMDALGEAINDDAVFRVKSLVDREMGEDFDNDEYPEDITDSDDVAGL